MNISAGPIVRGNYGTASNSYNDGFCGRGTS